jgi:CBS domain-containing protein
MNAKVQDLMVPSVTTTTPGESVGRVREIMSAQHISSIPVVDPEGVPIGIVTATDLIDDPPDELPVERIMAHKVYVVSQYDDVSVAARVMRNQRIHHVVVTHEKKIVGILSSFDLLTLVEDHRFSMKNAPTPKRTRRRTGGHRETDMDVQL